jgi:hypothetical protein
VKELDALVERKLQRLLLYGEDIDGPDRTPPPLDWTGEKEESFLECSAHARDCRRRKALTIERNLRARLQGIDGTDPRSASSIRWVLSLAGERLPTEEDRASFNSLFNRLLGDERMDPTLRKRMWESVKKFEWLYAALYPLIGQQVQTPQGRGTLLTVFASQCEIRPDGSSQTYRVPPSAVCWDQT